MLSVLEHFGGSDTWKERLVRPSCLGVCALTLGISCAGGADTGVKGTRRDVKGFCPDASCFHIHLVCSENSRCYLKKFNREVKGKIDLNNEYCPLTAF